MGYTVSGAHLRGVCAQVQRMRRAGAPGWVHPEPATVRHILEHVGEPTMCTGNRPGALTAAGYEDWAGAGCSGSGV